MWSLVSIAMRIVSAILVLPLMLRTIAPNELGLWYVFLSLGMLGGMVDFGFSHSITRAVAYSWAGARKILPLGLHEDEGLSQDLPPNWELLEKLIATARVFYWATALISGFLLLTAGSWWIWLKTDSLEHATSLRFAWVVWCVGGMLNGLGNVWPPLLSGINAVRESERISAIGLIVNSALTVLGLLFGLGIWALVLSNVAMGLTGRVLGKRVFCQLTGDSLIRTPGRIDWEIIRVLWPMSWRGGSVSIGVYLILQANTLICSQVLGLKATARYGLSMQLISLLKDTCSIWVRTKQPLMIQLRARGMRDEVASLFAARVRLSMICYIIGSVIILLYGDQLLNVIHAKTLLLPGALLLLLLFSYLLDLHNSLYAGLVLTENKNPFVLCVLLSGIGVVLLSVILTPHLGVLGMILAFLIAQSSYNHWWPVLRGIRGLGYRPAEYWKIFFTQKRVF